MAGAGEEGEAAAKPRALYAAAGVDFPDQTETEGPGVRLRHPIARQEDGGTDPAGEDQTEA